ncbi:MAG: hypothetical protein U0521_23265 [Anaerolineae bacterium]
MNPTADAGLAWRDQFPILSTCTYLISNSLGAMPRGVYDRLREYADTWATLGVRAGAPLPSTTPPGGISRAQLATRSPC